MSLGSGTSSDLSSLATDEAPKPPIRSTKDTDRQHGRSPSQIAWDRLKGDKVAIICFGIVIFFVMVAIFAPLLVIGFVAATLSTIVGITLGLRGGYLGGKTDKTNRVGHRPAPQPAPACRGLRRRPRCSAALHPGRGFLTAEEKSGIRFYVLICILVVFGWLGLARLIRGEVFSLREREFVQAAKVVGVKTRQILFKEILPNLVGPIIVSASIAVPAYITAEATLSYLGAGLVEPTPSWGRTVSNAQNAYARYPATL